MSDLLKELYQEIILDHGNTPRNFGKCEPFNKSADGHNPLCGDKVHLTLLIDDQNIIKDIKFTGEGCAISIASTSLMTQNLKGKSLDLAFFLPFDMDTKNDLPKSLSTRRLQS